MPRPAPATTTPWEARPDGGDGRLETAGSLDAYPPAMEGLLVRLRELAGVDRTRTTILLDTQFEREPDPAALR